MGLISRVSSRTYRNLQLVTLLARNLNFNMSSGIPDLGLSASDAKKILAAKTHLGNINCNYQMQQYVHARASSGANIFHLGKMWEKIQVAARIIAAVENPEDVTVVCRKDIGQRAIIKFAKFTGATSVNGRFSPGTFTNHSQAGFREPRIIIVADPTIDHQPVREASYVNIPVIALCDTDTPLVSSFTSFPEKSKDLKAPSAVKKNGLSCQI